MPIGYMQIEFLYRAAYYALACLSLVTRVSTVDCRCSSVCRQDMKNRSRADFSGTAGYRMGCTLIPRSNSVADSRAAFSELCVMAGTTASRSDVHTFELQSLVRISYAVLRLK